MAIAMKSEPSGLNKHYRKNEEIINNVTDGGINFSYRINKRKAHRFIM